MAPTLSLVGVVRNCATHIDEWVRRGRAFADEIVLCVDASSTDATWERAGRLADSVHAFEHLQQTDDIIDWALRRASGDWILRLDDDEFASGALAASLPRLIADRHLTHYRIPRRWVVRGPGAGPAWLAAPPWEQDTSLRLIRGVGSIFRHPGRNHVPVEIDGEGRVLDPAEGVIWHLNLAWRSRAEREAKVAGYHRTTPWVPCGPVYLYEDLAGAGDFRPVPPAELDGLWPLPAGGHAGAQDPDVAGATAPPPQLVRSRAATLLGVAEHADPPPVFRLAWTGHDLPISMTATTRRSAAITVRNLSATTWRGTGRPLGCIGLWHTWVDAGGSHHGGGTVALPRSVRALGSVTVPLDLIAPREPGTYTITADLEVRGAGRMSSRGQPLLRHEVAVTPGDQPAA